MRRLILLDSRTGVICPPWLVLVLGVVLVLDPSAFGAGIAAQASTALSLFERRLLHWRCFGVFVRQPLALATNMAILMAMKNETNIAALKNHLCDVLAHVAEGNEVVVCKRNVPVARIVPTKAVHRPRKRSAVGCMKGTVTFLGPVTGPIMAEDEWNMLKG